MFDLFAKNDFREVVIFLKVLKLGFLGVLRGFHGVLPSILREMLRWLPLGLKPEGPGQSRPSPFFFFFNISRI